MEIQKRFETPKEEHEHLENLVREKLSADSERDHEEIVDEALREHIEYSIHDDPVGRPKEEDRQVELLVHDAMNQGIIETARRVRNTGNPWLFREFYIALHERYVNDLRAKGVIESHG